MTQVMKGVKVLEVAQFVFVPCAGGISHNEAESASPQDLAAGCRVLIRAVLARAGEVSRKD